MTRGKQVSDAQELPIEDRSEVVAMRYLCGAPFLRYPMLPRKLRKAARRDTREMLPVGRMFAHRVLNGSEMIDPAPGIDVAGLIRHAQTGWRQSQTRDMAIGLSVLACAVRAPLGTIVWLSVGISGALLPLAWSRWRKHGRRRLAAVSVWVLAIGAILDAIARRGGESRSLALPLATLAACLGIYVLDSMTSWYRIRRLPATIVRDPNERRGLRLSPKPVRPATEPQNVVAYEHERMVGAGELYSRHTLTIPIEEAQDGRSPQRFHASDLLHYIASHIRNQGVAGTNTHPLPDLRVREVVARPLHLMNGLPVRFSQEAIGHTARSAPSGTAQRVYIAAQATTWGGELVGTIYVSVALEGRFLRLVVLPYVLGPIAEELRTIDKIASRPLLAHVLASSTGAFGELWLVFRTARAAGKALIRRLRGLMGEEEMEDEQEPTRTLRERYAVETSQDLHQIEDGLRITQVMEQRVFAVTETFLDEHGIATKQFQQQVSQVLNSYVIIEGSNNNVATGNGSLAGNNNATAPKQTQGVN